MSDVYMASYLNIAAIDAEDSQGGLSLNLDPRLHVAPTEDSTQSFKVWTPGSDTSEIYNSKLAWRGWYVEEKLVKLAV
jgi:hypothetical protein